MAVEPEPARGARAASRATRAAPSDASRDTGPGESRDAADDARQGPRPAWVRWLRRLALAAGAALLVASPWWGPRVLGGLDYFHVRQVVFDGVRFARPADLVAVLRVDTTQSVWQALAPLGERVARHPLVAAASVERQLPGTLVVHVVERQPVALVPARGVLRPTDVSGATLPIDPTRVPRDVPVAQSADSVLLHLLDGLRQHAPGVYARITHAQRPTPGELRLVLGSARGSIVVRALPDVTVSRFRDILPVEADLARNQLRAAELDLRFRDQVIARQP